MSTKLNVIFSLKSHMRLHQKVDIGISNFFPFLSLLFPSFWHLNVHKKLKLHIELQEKINIGIQPNFLIKFLTFLIKNERSSNVYVLFLLKCALMLSCRRELYSNYHSYRAVMRSQSFYKRTFMIFQLLET